MPPRNPMRRYFRHGLLPQLVAFEACIRLGSVTRAAEELSLAQPTLSCMLRKLAETFGGPLTVVRGRRVEPTPLGREVLDLSDELIAAFERFGERGGRMPGYDRRPQPTTGVT
jgi:LysR family transcriptional regulator, low CO2-responsive transcriptional regulator